MRDIDRTISDRRKRMACILRREPSVPRVQATATSLAPKRPLSHRDWIDHVIQQHKQRKRRRRR